MPKLNVKVPKLSHHKARGQACVYHDGRRHYLGPWGSAQARDAYRKFIHRISAPGKPETPTAATTASPARVEEAGEPILVGELILAYLVHVDAYYCHPDGTPTRAAGNIRDALVPLRQLFDDELAPEFGPRRLKRVRAVMVAAGLARHTINSRVGKIRGMFRWAVAEELVDAKTLTALEAVGPLMPGRGGRETAPREPVPMEVIEQTLPHMSPLLRAATLFLLWTGCRVGEAFALTPAMIDRSGDPWKAKLDRHKTAHATGKPRIIRIGPKARSMLEPWLVDCGKDQPVFSPLRADDRQPRRKGKRTPGASYCRVSIGQAMRRACARAFPHPTISAIPPRKRSKEQKAELMAWNRRHRWSLAQLRHTAATRFREEHGLDVGAQLLGHAKPDTTLLYSSHATKNADEAARQAG